VTPAPDLIALLYQNIGKPLTSDLAADICMAASSRQARPMPAPADFGMAIYDASEEVGPIVFQVERMVDVVPEIKLLHAAHWKETEGYRADIGFDPDYVQYVSLDRAGQFLLVTARAGNKMVGYFMVVLHHSRHSSKYVAAEDAFYLVPACRRGFALLKMLRFTERCVQLVGAKQMILSEKLTNPLGAALKRAGFSYCANLWTKVL
jgi:hypothetical protein